MDDQINLTDDASRIMPVAGGGFEQCYNAQAMIDPERMLVVVPKVMQAINDNQQVLPMLAQAVCPVCCTWPTKGATARSPTLNLVALDVPVQAHLYLTAKDVAAWVDEEFGVTYTASGMTALLDLDHKSAQGRLAHMGLRAQDYVLQGSGDAGTEQGACAPC